MAPEDAGKTPFLQFPEESTQKKPSLPDSGLLTGTNVPSVSAAGSVLMNGSTGEIYFSRNADLRLPMASTTKIMTALVAIESVPLDRVVRVAPEAVGVEGSSIYLYKGEEMRMESLLYALLLASANDAAAAIAYEVAGSIPAFAEKMNEKASALGLRNTHFENPHGLDSEEHYTTARDLALLTAAAMQNETFRRIVSTERITIPQVGSDGVRLLRNHNRLLRSYEGCIGVKTGFTKRSGRCLVSAAERDGLLLIAVTLKAPDDWRDHAAMLDYGFSHYEAAELPGSDCISIPLPVVNGVMRETTVSFRTENTLPLRVSLPKNHGEITVRYELPRFLWGNVRQGDVIGYAIYLCGDKELVRLPLTADESIPEISYRFHLRKRLSALFGISEQD